MSTNNESGNGNGKAGLVWIAVYTRKSNDENLNIEVTSIDNQKGCCRSYIEIQKHKGWREYPETFDDPAQSGKSLDRPAMKRILQRIQEGKVQGVIVYKLDRLTRNSRDFHGLLELFEKHGVAFISATESIDTKSPQGRLMTAIMVQFAQYDRELDQERSRDTHLARARKGLWCAGLPPLGYDIKDKLLVVNPQEAELVREIFGLYLRHKSTLVVAKELNRLNYRRKTYKAQDGRLLGGKPFDPDTVCGILRRKVYIGIITNGRSGQEFPGLHTPLVSPRVFEKVQAILAGHRLREEATQYANNKHGFLLKGLVRCGECDAAMVGFVQPKKGKQYRYYRCIGRDNGRRSFCPVKCIGADKIEEFVIEKLAVIGSDRPFLERVVHKVAKESKSKIRPMKREMRRIEQRIRETRREMQNLLNMVKSGGNSQGASAEIKRLEDA
ncbi:MAG: recombinase family protein, partial [Elusimicrobia bacterium]|nr:recombinase family protein [Elusimicrobiota bacterium]